MGHVKWSAITHCKWWDYKFTWTILHVYIYILIVNIRFFICFEPLDFCGRTITSICGVYIPGTVSSIDLILHRIFIFICHKQCAQFFLNFRYRSLPSHCICWRNWEGWLYHGFNDEPIRGDVFTFEIKINMNWDEVVDSEFNRFGDLTRVSVLLVALVIAMK